MNATKLISTLLFLAVLPVLVSISYGDDPAMDPARVFLPAGEGALPKERLFQGIPGAATTPGDRIWATWYGGGDDEGPHNYVMVAFSDDRGDHWSGIQAIVHHPHPNVRTYDSVVWVDPDGKLWLFYAQSYAWWDGRAGTWAVTMEDPDADQPIWSEPRRLVDGIMMNKPTVLNDGRWLFPVAIWGGEPRKDDPRRPDRHLPDQYNHWDPDTVGTKVIVSSDKGQTFEEIASLNIENVLFDEHMFVEREDGSLWMKVRGREGMIEAISEDGGYSWSEPRMADQPHVNARFFIRRLESGNLILVRHQTPDETGVPREGPDGRRQTDRTHLTAYLSKDDGLTWEGGLVLDERLWVSYPDGDQLSDETIVIAYDIDRKGKREILLARFTEEDILAGDWISEGADQRLLINKADIQPAEEDFFTGDE